MHGEIEVGWRFAGTVEKVDGQNGAAALRAPDMVLEGAASLSQLAAEEPRHRPGASFHARSQKSLLFEVIEIIPITEEAAASIAIVPEWRS